MISTIDYLLYHLMETYVLSSSHLVLKLVLLGRPKLHEVTNLCGVHSAASGHSPPFTGFASVDEGG